MNNTLEYNGFLGSVEYSAADEVFFGRIVGITDHITYDGFSIFQLTLVITPSKWAARGNFIAIYTNNRRKE